MVVQLPFLDRAEERRRLERLLDGRRGSLAVLYGRRRRGKSRLIREVIRGRACVYYVGDDREAPLQRAGLAGEIGRFMPGFDAVGYPGWDALLARWYGEARPGTVLVLDEFPALVAAAREIPGLLQKRIDGNATRGVHLILAGSSRRMMQGLVLDRSAPLYGRAHEILEILPLGAGWIPRALGIGDPVRAIEAFSVWGGVPGYWELAAGHPGLGAAVEALVLSPLGVLRDEPAGLLLDDLRDTTQAASILGLIGQGCRRLSEIAAGIGKPATSLSRPLQRLVDLGLVRREVPFGSPVKDARRTAYRIGDPFLRFWFRFVEPARSRLESGRLRTVVGEVARAFPLHVSGVWKDLARLSATRLRSFGRRWTESGRWWGTGLHGRPMEIDVLARSADDTALLVGEARWSARVDARRLVAELERKAANLPAARGREVFTALWLREGGPGRRGARIVTPRDVLAGLR
jgi:hypothetical protein